MENTQPGAHDTDNSPIAPLFVYIHRKRPIADHEQGWVVQLKVLEENLGKESMTRFNEHPKVFVTDREFTTLKWPKCTTVYCWNHIRKNIERKLMALNYDQKERTALDRQFYRALTSTTEDSYLRKIERYKAAGNGPWGDKAFTNYYEKNIDDDVRKHAGRWVLTRLNVPNPERGITNNAAESFNKTMATVKEGGENLMHEATVKLRYIFDVGNNKFDDAFYGIGQYQLRPDFGHLLRPLKLLPERSTLTPEQRNMEMVNYYGLPSADNFEHNVKAPELSRTDYEALTLQAQAQYLYDNKKVTHVPAFHSYLTSEPGEKIHRVVVTPPSCECGSKYTCAHMLAVKRFNGSVKDFSLATKTRQNKDDKPDRMGRKTPTKAATSHVGIEGVKKLHRKT